MNNAPIVEPPNVWAITSHDEFERDGFPGAVHVVGHTEYGQILPLFTDRHLAERFIEESQKPDREPLAISSKTDLRFLVVAFQEIQLEYVAVDCPRLDNPRYERGWLFPVEFFLATYC